MKPSPAQLKKAAQRKLLLDEGLKAQYQELDSIERTLVEANKGAGTLRLPGMDVEIEDNFLDRDGEMKTVAFGKVAAIKRWKINIRPTV